MSLIKPDLLLFVGDISEGDIKLIKKINSIEIPTYIILGNHDRGKDKTGYKLEKQIRILKEKYCGWDLKVFNNKINILGARPCSAGGGYFLSREVLGLYGPLTEEESVKKIIRCSQSSRKELPLLLLAHSGPTGLGSDASSICGKDWKEPALDWGDRDLYRAIKNIQDNRNVDIVIFGHMHNKLKRNQGMRQMFVRDSKGTCYLNAAVVPRYKKSDEGELIINFSWVVFKDKKLKYVSQRWYGNLGQIVKEEVFYNS